MTRVRLVRVFALRCSRLRWPRPAWAVDSTCPYPGTNTARRRASARERVQRAGEQRPRHERGQQQLAALHWRRHRGADRDRRRAILVGIVLARARKPTPARSRGRGACGRRAFRISCATLAVPSSRPDTVLTTGCVDWRRQPPTGDTMKKILAAAVVGGLMLGGTVVAFAATGGPAPTHPVRDGQTRDPRGRPPGRPQRRGRSRSWPTRSTSTSKALVAEPRTWQDHRRGRPEHNVANPYRRRRHRRRGQGPRRHGRHKRQAHPGPRPPRSTSSASPSSPPTR